MRLSSSFGASRASRLDAILQKKNRVPSNEKRELLKKKTVTASLTTQEVILLYARRARETIKIRDTNTECVSFAKNHHWTLSDKNLIFFSVAQYFLLTDHYSFSRDSSSNLLSFDEQ